MPATFTDVISTGPYQIRFPQIAGVDQDQEWCDVFWDNRWRRIRFHDYSAIYTIPGLYETIFYRTLRCNSPYRVTEMLGQVLAENHVDPDDLRVLDFGAGNGMVGEMLQNLGTRLIIGVDILPEAKAATERDRPWAYSDYIVGDIAELMPQQERLLRDAKFNALTTVAALGFGDIPPAGFRRAFNLIEEGGWLAFNLKEEFWQQNDTDSFGATVRAMLRDGNVRMEAYRRYCHRLSVTGDPLHYIAVIARKLRHVTEPEGSLNSPKSSSSRSSVMTVNR